MTVKNKIISVLEKNPDKIFSGQKLAGMLSVSRSAVWKAVESLRKDGYTIKASTNKGYSLFENADILSGRSIKTFLSKKYKNIPIQIYNSLNSTNTFAKKLAADGAKHATVVIADEQTSGRGRFNRSFFSPEKTGIYMSVILKPRKAVIEDVSLTTIASAVCVCRAIEKLTCLKPQIKWVNDIFINGKKVCGILTEALSDFETKTVENIVTGIGINVKTQLSDFPKELKKTASSLFEPELSRNRLIAEILNNLFDLNNNLNGKNLIKEYKSYSFILGRQISFIQNDKLQIAKAVDINEKGNLIVKISPSKNIVLESGEVSLLTKFGT